MGKKEGKRKEKIYKFQERKGREKETGVYKETEKIKEKEEKRVCGKRGERERKKLRK